MNLPTPMPPQTPITEPTEQSPKIGNKLFPVILTGLLCALLIGAGLYFSYRGQENTLQDQAIPATTTEPDASRDVWNSLSLEAKAVYVYDARDNTVLYAKNSDVSLPLASLTKLLTALVAATTLPNTSVITIDQQTLATDGDSGLFVGEQFGIEELSAFMLVISSNDAATALRRTYENTTGGSFIAAMNTESERLGLSMTFENETGLDIGDRAANTGSAHDVALLMEEVLHRIPEIIDASRNDSFVLTSKNGARHVVKSTNMLVHDIPWAVGAKTGFTDSAGGNLVISLDVSIGHPVIIVVLGSSKEGRFTDMKKLVETTLESLHGNQ